MELAPKPLYSGGS